MNPRSRKRGGKKSILHRPTRFNNVSYYESKKKRHDGKPDKCFFIRYVHEGKQIREKVGWASEGYTAQAAHQIYAERLRKIRHGEELPSKKPILTLNRVAEKYFEDHGPTLRGKSRATDENRWENHLKDSVGKNTTRQLGQLDVDRIRLTLQKHGMAAGTVANVLELLRRIVNYGVDRKLCPPLSFRIKLPGKKNMKTELLTPEQWERVIAVLDEYENQAAANMVRVALFTGLRRGEIFRLKWEDLDFRNRIIYVREPKSGEPETIVMNDMAHDALKNHEAMFRTEDVPYVFPGRKGQGRVFTRVGRIIRDKAGLPKDFRPFHGMRHAFASRLAESGEVDLYHIQKLLRHRSPEMTQRYAHLRDEALRRASNVLTHGFRKREVISETHG
jgi:integrase